MNRSQIGASLNLRIHLIPTDRHNRPGRAIAPTSITLHNTSNANAGADADAHARFVANTGHYVLSNGRKNWVSWHYTVDDIEVVKHLPINEEAWHAGPANKTSIGIETCMHAGIDQDAADDRLARLVAVLRHDLGLGRDAIKTHRDWTGKNCPVLLLNKWEALMDRIDGYVAGMAAAAGPQMAAAMVEDDAGDIDHAAIALALSTTEPQVTDAIPAASSQGLASPVPVLREADDLSRFDPTTMDPNEPDESFTGWAQSLLGYESRAALDAVVQAAPFQAFDGYKSDFAASYADLKIQHFKPHEFLAMGGNHGNPAHKCYNKNGLPPRALWPNMRPLAVALDEIRRRLNARVRLTSVYRNDAYNGCLPGSASNSYHKRFMAADFQCETGSSVQWRDVARQVRADGVFTGGIGIYNSFVHVDVRGTNQDWDAR